MKVLLLHPGAAARDLIAKHLRDAGMEVQALDDSDELLMRIDPQTPAIVVADLCLPDLDDGLQLLARCRGADPLLPVVALVAQNDAATAVAAIRKGAYEVLTLDQMQRLDTVCQRAMAARRLTLQLRSAEEADDPADALTSVPGLPPISEVMRGRHPTIRKLRASLLRLARVETDVLINGDTGCGKEVVARCLHDYGPRASKPFVAINCGAIPENIFESELFGHESGAFTGAAKRRIGKLEFASGGTVFLDEIESMPMAMQVKLLRALQQRTVERVGGNEAIKLNCRVVVATKDNLLTLARQGRFRMDLYYRLNVIELSLPSLNDRREDIPLLANGFAAEAGRRHGLADAKLDVEFVCRLMARDWPGNVRELRNAVEREVLGLHEPLDDADGTDVATFSLAQQLAAFERALIEHSLRACCGSVTRVCALLCVPRKTLYDKLTRLSVDPANFRVDMAARAPLGYATARLS